MENTNTGAESITSDELIANILGKYSPEPSTPPTPPAEQSQPVVNTEAIAEPVKEEEVQQPIQITDYSKRLKSAIQDGLLENFAVTYGENEVYLEDISDLTEEGYNEIIKGWKSEKDKQLKENYTSLTDLDETTKKLIEIKRAGGDIKEIIRENISALDNIQQLKENIDNEKVQINIVGQNLEKRGISLKTIQTEIRSLIESGELESEATKILDSEIAVHSQAIEEKRLSNIQRVEQEKEDLKNLRKNLTSKYKELGVPENLHKLLVDNATKLDADKISNTDKLYFEAIKDPETLAELNYFLNNREEYKKWVSSKKTLDTKLATLKPLFTVNINNQKKPNISQDSVNEYAERILNKQ